MKHSEVSDDVLVTPGLKNILEEFDIVVKNLTVFKNNVTELQHQIRNLEKNVKKEMKIMNKNINKNKKKGNHNPSGFAHPTKVTKELCDFMNIEENSMIARTDVTRNLISYIKEHNLQDPLNKKRIVPDDKLKNLLGLESEDELTYFNIQKYMNKHFIKKNKNDIELA